MFARCYEVFWWDQEPPSPCNLINPLILSQYWGKIIWPEASGAIILGRLLWETLYVLWVVWAAVVRSAQCTVHVYNTLLLCITRPSNCKRHRPICTRHRPPTYLEPGSRFWVLSGHGKCHFQRPSQLPCKRAKTVISEFKWFKCALTPTSESRDLGQSEASILTNQRPVFRPIRG